MTNHPDLAAIEPEGAEVLAADLARLDAGQYWLVAEWMLEHGWTEPLDPLLLADTPSVEPPSREAVLDDLLDAVPVDALEHLLPFADEPWADEVAEWLAAYSRTYLTHESKP